MDAVKPQVVAEAGNPERAAGEATEVTALVAGAKKGDAEAFAGLMRLYDRRVIAIGVQMGLSHDDALDACQDAFVKVFRYIGRFRSGESFYKWLYRIAINAVYDHLSWSRWKRSTRPVWQACGATAPRKARPSRPTWLASSLPGSIVSADRKGSFLFSGTCRR